MDKVTQLRAELVKDNEWIRKASARIAELERKLFAQEQRRERFEEECECAHKWLDEQGVPRADADADGALFSLIGRMMRLTSNKC